MGNVSGAGAARQVGECCSWHKLAPRVSLFPCTRPPRPGRSTCAQHSAELDLNIFEAAHSPRCAWLVYWSTGYRTSRRISTAELSEYLLEREPDGLLEASKDRSQMELRVHGRLVAVIQRKEALK